MSRKGGEKKNIDRCTSKLYSATTKQKSEKTFKKHIYIYTHTHTHYIYIYKQRHIPHIDRDKSDF